MSGKFQFFILMRKNRTDFGLFSEAFQMCFEKRKTRKKEKPQQPKTFHSIKWKASMLFFTNTKITKNVIFPKKKRISDTFFFIFFESLLVYWIKKGRLISDWSEIIFLLSRDFSFLYIICICTQQLHYEWKWMKIPKILFFSSEKLEIWN